MADKILNVRIQNKYDTEANWKAKDPVLLKGEQAFTSDGTNAGKHKIGDGTSKWSALSYAKASLSKGDVTTALGYTPPASNTWRGIQNNLTSDSTSDSLSAAQGKVLKGLVDGKAASSHTHTITQISNLQSTLDGKALKSHTHNYAGSSSVGGSANSAVKLTTARSISIGGLSSGSANFDGSGNITIDNWGYGCKKYVTQNSTSAPYFRIAYCEDKSNYSDRSMIFVIDSGYSGGGFGIVKVAFRGNDISKEGQSNCELKWLVRQGFSANQLFVKGNAPAGESQYADLYFKATTTYQAISITVLSMGNRGSKIRVWTFEEGNTRANPDIRKYTYTVEGSDAGTANYANSAGAIAWGNISGKPSTFTPASHTHSYAGAAASGGSANSAIKLDTTTAGSSTQPVYFTGGKPTACTYTLGKSVPSNAVFTDTNTWRPLGTTANTACAGNDSRLSNARPASDVYSWAKASAKPSYSWSEITGKPGTFTPSSHDHTRLQGTMSSASVPGKSSDGFMTYHYNVNNGLTNNMPSTNNANAIITISRHGGDYTTQLGFSSNDNIYYRNGVGTTAWKKMLDSSNYTSYTVTKTGSGASGTWGINVTGSAGSVAWGNVSGRPSSMPASDVYSWAKASSKPSYSWSEISGRPSSLPASDVYAWAKASTKPSYSWSEIGSKPSTFTPASHTHNYLAIYGSRPANINFSTSTNGTGAMFHFVATSSTTTGKPPEDSNVLQLNWDNNGGYDSQVSITNSDGHMYFRGQSAGKWNDWKTVIDSSNIGSQSVKYANSAGAVAWGNVSGKPSTFTPSSHSHSYLPLSGGTLTGQIKRDSCGGSWISARTNAPLVGSGSTSGGWNPIVAQKTKNGSWSIGNLNGNEYLSFSYTTDTDYNNGKNVATTINLPPTSGTLCLTNHTHPYLPTTGGTLNNGSTQCPLIITGAANNESSITFKYKTQTSGGHWVVGQGAGTANIDTFSFYKNGAGTLATLMADGQFRFSKLTLSGYQPKEYSAVGGVGAIANDYTIRFRGGTDGYFITKGPSSLNFGWDTDTSVVGDGSGSWGYTFRMQMKYCYCDVGFRSSGIYHTTISGSSNLNISSDGTIKRVSSAAKYKLDIQNINKPDTYAYNLLNLNPKQWFDKGETERYAKYLTAQYSGEKLRDEEESELLDGSINPYYGLIAEDVKAAGLDEFCIYGKADKDGKKELEGIQYDRLPILTIPILRDLVTCMQKILPSVEKNISDSTLLSEVKEIESRFNSFNPQNIVNKQYAN